MTSDTLSIFRAREWDRNAIHTYFQAKAASAEAYLSELRAKLSARPAYEPIYDETLASYYVHNYFHGRTWLASRHFASTTQGEPGSSQSTWCSPWGRALQHTPATTSDENAWPTPRSWEMASSVLSSIARRRQSVLLSGTNEFETQLVDGAVGSAASAELTAFLRLFRELPSIDEVLLTPDTAPVPTETSAQIAVATALGRVMSDASIFVTGIAFALWCIGKSATQLSSAKPTGAWPRDTRASTVARIYG